MKIFCFVDGTNTQSILKQAQALPDAVVPIFDLARVRLQADAGGHAANESKQNLVASVPFADLKKTCPSFGFVVSRVEEIQACKDFAAFIYIPGEYCRQSDILEAAAQAKKTILLERGAFLTPKDLLLAYQKIAASDVWFVDAGSSFGYGDRVLDVRALAIYKAEPNSRPFGIHLSELIEPQMAAKAAWAQTWSHNDEFANALWLTAQTLGASFVCCRHVHLKNWFP